MKSRSVLRAWMHFLLKTPLHPQWLLRREKQLMRHAVSGLRGMVLDVGCGDRWISAALDHDVSYIALDYPKAGGEFYGSRPDIYGDATALPVGDEVVDGVVMLEVLEHIRGAPEALKEAFRVLRRGGICVVSVPFCYPIHDAPHDYQRWTEHGLVRDLSEAGFDVDSIRPRLHSAEGAALNATIVMAAIVLESVKKKGLDVLLTPVLIMLIPLVNVSGWLVARVFPSWKAYSNGYIVRAKRPAFAARES